MDNKTIENNQVVLTGRIVSQFAFSHEVFGEGFYLTDLEVQRLSNQIDVIPVMVSDRLVDVTSDATDQVWEIEGQFRSYNKHEESKNRLVLSVFAREVNILNDFEGNDTNSITLFGYICKPPVYRKTPLGREIADILLAVNRPYGKSDYIPCICWGRNARFASDLSVGTCLDVQGRIQSREYLKKISEDETEKRVAYEVSVSKIDVTEE